MQKIEAIIFQENKPTEWIYVYLNGVGEFGEDRESLYLYHDFPLLIRNRKLISSHPFIVLHALDGERWDINSVDIQLNKLKEKFSNPKIHLIGYSRGGYGVYEYISKFKGVLKATIINSKTFKDLDTDTHIEIFHAKRDQLTPTESVKAFANRINKSGHSITFSEFNGDHHSVAKVALSGIVA